MNKSGPIIVIEDDEDDQMILSDVFEKLNYPNKIIFFANGIDALDYLTQNPEHPFLILSDINMPKLSGLELREKIMNNASLALKCIPYLYFTTTATKDSVIAAYSKSAQGFFVKPSKYSEVEEIIKKIVEYWTICYAPNTF